MLELRGERAVLGHRRPAVGEDLHLGPAGVDHRLDGEEHPFAQQGAVLGLAEMKDRWGIVEDPPDAVTAEIAHHGEALRLGMGLDRGADGADTRTRPHRLDALHHRLEGDVDEAARFQRNLLAEEEHAAGIAMPAVEDHRHVDVEDVAVHQAPVAGDAVADDVVQRGADGAREAAVVERRRDCVVIDDEAVAEPVELVGGDARLDVRRDEVERGGGEGPGLAHAREILGAVDLDPPLVVLRAGRRRHLRPQQVELHPRPQARNSRQRTESRPSATP